MERKRNAGGNCIPSANYRVQAEGHFVLPITDGVCVCGCKATIINIIVSQAIAHANFESRYVQT